MSITVLFKLACPPGVENVIEGKSFKAEHASMVPTVGEVVSLHGLSAGRVRPYFGEDRFEVTDVEKRLVLTRGAVHSATVVVHLRLL